MVVSSQGPLVAISDQLGTSPGNMVAHTACQGDFHEGQTACFQKLPLVEPLKETFHNPVIYFSVLTFVSQEVQIMLPWHRAPIEHIL